MSMVAVFELPCCKRKIVFGRYKPQENAVSIECPLFHGHGRVKLDFFSYVEEHRIFGPDKSYQRPIVLSTAKEATLWSKTELETSSKREIS